MKPNYKKLDSCRNKTGPYRSQEGDTFGFFYIPIKKAPFRLNVLMAPEGNDWEHVSVSTPNRCPTWEEMCFVKSLFWGEDETVIQYHPPKSEYVNNHPYCLHLWRPSKIIIPLPPTELVGIKS